MCVCYGFAKSWREIAVSDNQGAHMKDTQQDTRVVGASTMSAREAHAGKRRGSGAYLCRMGGLGGYIVLPAVEGGRHSVVLPLHHGNLQLLHSAATELHDLEDQFHHKAGHGTVHV